MNLFRVLDGIMSSEDRAEILANSDMIISYADAAGQSIDYAQAERIQSVGQDWLADQSQGNGEWSRMRHEAAARLGE